MEEIEEVKQEEKYESEEVRLWSWGAGTDGQLGTGRLQDEQIPQQISLSFTVSSLACGGAHVIALTHGTYISTPPPLFFLFFLQLKFHIVIVPFFIYTMLY
jgi:secretion-regulating guanine nucleotide exchange factor